jgi:hypothetical protein
MKCFFATTVGWPVDTTFVYPTVFSTIKSLEIKSELQEEKTVEGKRRPKEKSRLDIDDATFRGDRYCVGAISRAELRENASHVSLDGIF